MPTTQKIAPLAAGDTLTWEEFEARWDATPEIKFAELIGGKVYMPPPLSIPHGEMDGAVIFWLQNYAIHTPGCKSATNATVRLFKDAPQPDAHLRLKRECGGRSRVKDNLLHGAPELAAEICLSSAAYDLHEKKELYRAAGVQEYLAVLMHEEEVRWHRLEGGSYKLLKPAKDGVIRSIVFPGLWLDTRALLKENLRQVLETLNQGLATEEHLKFAAELATKMGS